MIDRVRKERKEKSRVCKRKEGKVIEEVKEVEGENPARLVEMTRETASQIRSIINLMAMRSAKYRRLASLLIARV
jgi:K+/H+ antiporter YhaU regulatory subunit KhtT